ncbi:MAG TPA: phosphoribosylformylglycinamidine synthase subunit PurS [Pyrinomonadaceae bacterium]|nr:phosphoribosylformylglycinamidine synthase subunit PurS [Pyrinomonadaceae bacterium]
MKVSKLLINNTLEEADARETITRMAREVLSNPVIEDFRVEIEG